MTSRLFQGQGRWNWKLKICSATKNDQKAKNVSITTVCHMGCTLLSHGRSKSIFCWHYHNSLSHGIQAWRMFCWRSWGELTLLSFECNWICCRLRRLLILNTDYCCGWLNLLINHFHFLKEPFDMFQFTITELKYRTISIWKTWQSFPSLLPQMSNLSRSVKGKLIFWSLSPFWSPGCLSPRVESNDSTVLSKFDPLWSPQIRSAKIIQLNTQPKLELSWLKEWSIYSFAKS